MSDPLDPFEPRWEGETLVLTLRRFNPQAILTGVVGVVGTAVSLALLAVGLWLALIGLALSTAASTLAVWLWVNRRHSPIRLRLSAEDVRVAAFVVRRQDVGTVSTQTRTLQIRSARSIFDVLHVQMLDHGPTELAQLSRVIRAWADNPAFGPDQMRPRPATGLSLLDRLEPLGAEPWDTGLRFFVREQRRSNFLFPFVGGLFGLVVGFLSVQTGPAAFIGLWVGALAGIISAVARWVGSKGEIRLDDRGISLVGRWTLSWEEIEAASVTDQHGVRLHTRNGGKTLEMASIRYAPVVAALITDLADPAPEQDVPEALRQMVSRQDKGRQEG